MTKYSPAKTGEYPRVFVNNIIFSGNVPFSEQIMSADKYPRHIFTPILEAIVYLPVLKLLSLDDAIQEFSVA